VTSSLVPLSDPFSIGTVTVPNRVVLAPMAGITTSAFRRRLKTFGAGLVSTEMVSAYGLLYGNRRTQDYLAFAEEERPVAVQLFGDRPEVVARAVGHVLATEPRPDVIDLNMGCPVRKVMKTGAGAALLADPAHAAAVARAAVEAATGAAVPVTVKLRSGLRPEEVVAVELARRLEDAGVEALAVHPRAASQFYRGRADHGVTADVVRAVGIPVVASGDVDGVAAARGIRAETGAAALMVARGMLGDPWLVGRLLADDAEDRRPTVGEAATELGLLLDEATADMGPERAVRWSRKLVAWYLRAAGAPGTTVRALQGLGALPLAEALRALGDGRVPLGGT
jgi:tRNA-dihydrouridine synthase B